MELEDYLRTQLKKIEQQGLSRKLKRLESSADAVVTTNGRRVIEFSSNNYLGLANHPALKEVAFQAVKTYGVGSGASRLIAGNMALYRQLEDRLAQFKGTEAALVFPTGYQANVGTITALAGPNDIIFSDALNHASIVDGCRLSRARIITYPHRDLRELETLLASAPQKGNRLIITDGVFSMDGTIAPLPGLVSLARQHGCWLMIDEAHATGILGMNGRGTAEHFQVEDGISIHMGTFSKALGSLGGYIAGSRTLINHLINRSRNLMYTTALPPAVLAVNRAAIDLVEEGTSLRDQLWERTRFLERELATLGFNTLETETPIIPLIVGDPRLTIRFSSLLFDRGVHAHGIRPPTVPEGLSRLRISVMATHSWDDLDRGLEVLEKTGRELGII